MPLPLSRISLFRIRRPLTPHPGDRSTSLVCHSIGGDNVNSIRPKKSSQEEKIGAVASRSSVQSHTETQVTSGSDVTAAADAALVSAMALQRQLERLLTDSSDVEAVADESLVAMEPSGEQLLSLEREIVQDVDLTRDEDEHDKEDRVSSSTTASSSSSSSSLLAKRPRTTTRRATKKRMDESQVDLAPSSSSSPTTPPTTTPPTSHDQDEIVMSRSTQRRALAAAARRAVPRAASVAASLPKPAPPALGRPRRRTRSTSPASDDEVDADVDVDVDVDASTPPLTSTSTSTSTPPPFEESHKALEAQIMNNLRDRVKRRYNDRRTPPPDDLLHMPSEERRMLNLFRACPPHLMDNVLFVTSLRNRLGRGKQFYYDPVSRNMTVTHERSSFVASVPKRGDALTMLIANLGNVPVLDRQEESKLTWIVHEGWGMYRAVQALTQQLGRRPDATEVAEHCQLTVQETRVRLHVSSEARELMCQYNIRMVINMASKLRKMPGIDVQDLVPAGITGLRLAIAKFDPNRGFKFSTYSHWWVRQSFNSYIAEHGRVLKLPQHISEIISKYRKVKAALKYRYPDDVPIAQVAALLGMNPMRLASIVRSAEAPRSLDAPLENASGKSSGDGKESRFLDELLTAPEQEDDIETRGRRERLKETYLKSRLDELFSACGLARRERNVLNLRYGLSQQFDAAALDKIGVAYSVTRERIRQIESRAFRKLRAPENAAHLKEIMQHLSELEVMDLPRPELGEDEGGEDGPLPLLSSLEDLA